MRKLLHLLLEVFVPYKFEWQIEGGSMFGDFFAGASRGFARIWDRLVADEDTARGNEQARETMMREELYGNKDEKE